MLVEAIVAVASAGVSAGAYAVSHRAGAALRDSFDDLGRALRRLPLGAGAWGTDPDADVLAAIAAADARRQDPEGRVADAQAVVVAGGAVPAAGGDRRGAGDPG